MKKVYIIVIFILVTGIIVFNIFRINSFSLAIKKAGFNPHDIIPLESDFDANGNEIKIIKTSSNRQEIVLVYMVKNKMGFWSVGYWSPYQYPDEESQETQPVCIGWMKPAGVKWYYINGNKTFETEWHLLYYGNNAIKLIEFLPDQIPDNVAVNIQQAGNEYSIHLIHFGAPDVLNNINMRSILLEAKCIKE
ncbi:hypothetical protein [Caldicoprobacter faecalis]|uniref:Uncharacterized protein n=1 Tax=Caldicoprobacter faecalis TaxID=937334 RepID=A0A1I5YTR0_9FIRM|nr:hypothetical protein [Caldicoprobacter faecalis]SFQ47435.1 hypothetical protein SAMN05444406_1641 [Caldicoprobacter faecalis]